MDGWLLKHNSTNNTCRGVNPQMTPDTTAVEKVERTREREGERGRVFLLLSACKHCQLASSPGVCFYFSYKMARNKVHQVNL